MSAPEWTFESTITTPDGLRADVTVTVPQSQAWPDVAEVAEIAQICASRAAQQATKMVRESRERCPF
ncbi:hypothetical protein JOF56_011659 [Kibdelosporangium banguiense]|uniref:Uncharacterized protein n=1 Tax=Kibdelosporangium banguiense TaxID=1365924 RepID=A0ABS4U3N2_9PSEU|nr:hypothetical protein [Kibdelosporangium banguiense]MBP2331274.1 hypothetical protein [Kibdelosporangium banguiense]